MHIFLDSNAYCADYRMRGPAFRALFHYLKITKSTLVISDLVVEEVLAAYRREVKKRLRGAREAVESLRRLLLDESSVEKLELDVHVRVSELAERLINPSDGIKALLHSDISGLNIKDVFMRGVLREAPAREDGEELRDVIIWFTALGFAKSAGDLAFISNDSGFWDGEKPKAQIMADINARGANIVLYRDISGFIKAHAPQPESISEAWFSQYSKDICGNNVLMRSAMDQACAAVGSLLRKHELQSPSFTSAEFDSGEHYNTGENTKFVELALRIKARADVIPKPYWDDFLSESPSIPTAGLAQGGFSPLAALAGPPRPVAKFEISAIANISAYIENNVLTDSAVQGVEILGVSLVDEESTSK